MKKGKIIALALAGAITFMGAGYAAWQDNVTIKSEVSTGNLDVRFVDGETPCGGILGNYAEIIEGRKKYTKLEDSGTKAKVNGEDDKLLTIAVSNFYPASKKDGKIIDRRQKPALSIHSSIQNKGSVPAKFESVDISPSNDSSPELYKNLRVEFQTIYIIEKEKEKGRKLVWDEETGWFKWISVDKIDTDMDWEHSCIDMSLQEFEDWLNLALEGVELNSDEMLVFANYDEELTTTIAPCFQVYIDKGASNETQGTSCTVNIKFNWVPFNQ